MLLQIGLVLLLIGGGWAMLTKGRRNAQRDSLTMRRVDAYIETIRRERNNPELAAMSDVELRDLLHSGARNLKIAEQKKNWVLLGSAALTLIAALALANQHGWAGFGIAFAVGALVTYGLNEFMVRRIRQPLTRLGIDVDRIRVE